MGLTADQATRMAPLLLAGVILAGGFALVAFLAPRGAVQAPTIEPTNSTVGDESVNFTESWPKGDWLALSDDLRTLNHLTGAETDPGPDGGDGPPPNGGVDDPPTGSAGPDDKYEPGDFKFVGAIIQVGGSAALIEVNGRQTFVLAGEEVADHTIVSIHRDHLIVEIDGGRRRMQLADTDRSSLNTAERFERDRDRAMERQREMLERERDNGRRSRPEPLRPDRDR